MKTQNKATMGKTAPPDIGNLLTAASIGAGICFGVISVSITLKQIVPPLPPTSLFYFLRNMGNKAVLALILYIWAVVSSLMYMPLKWKPFYDSAFIFTFLSSLFIAMLSIYYPVKLYIIVGLVAH